jgi:6-phosphogluconolactonase
MDQKNKIQVYPAAEELSEAAAEFIIHTAKNAVDNKGRFVISLSGGHTPEQLYILLSKPSFRDQMPWKKTFVFWGDERCVPSNDKQNNANMARTSLLDHIDIPSLNIHPIPVDLPPAEAAHEYENTIRNFFHEEAPCFDLILLGLGENGHTASLFPGTDVVSENERLVKEVYLAEQKMFRITMTAILINQAYNIVFLVEGEGKAVILDTVLNTSYQPDKYPAQLIIPVNGNLYWFVDKTAASDLSNQECA